MLLAFLKGRSGLCKKSPWLRAPLLVGRGAAPSALSRSQTASAKQAAWAFYTTPTALRTPSLRPAGFARRPQGRGSKGTGLRRAHFPRCRSAPVELVAGRVISSLQQHLTPMEPYLWQSTHSNRSSLYFTKTPPLKDSGLWQPSQATSACLPSNLNRVPS